MLSELAKHIKIRDTLQWEHIPVGEDVIISMYAYTVGKELMDASDEGELFGLAWQGLPFDPATMVARGYAIIHSLRTDSKYTEEYLHKFFAPADGRSTANRDALSET